MHGNRIRGNTSHQNIHRVAVKAKEEAARVDIRAIVK
jgi:hypothetical protein